MNGNLSEEEAIDFSLTESVLNGGVGFNDDNACALKK